MVLSEMKHLADSTLMPFLGDAGFVHADVETKRDFDGEEALLFTLHFKAGAEVATGAAYLNAQVALQSALQSAGDPRFPHFSYDYPDDPELFDAEEVFGAQ